MPEKVVIIGSGPAAWTAAIYAARANLHPLVFQGNPNDDRNRLNGTLPLGQLALTTEVENFPSWPAGDTRQYLKTALKEEDWPYWVAADKPQPTHGVNGPELVALCRQQAVNFGTRVESKDIVKVDLKHRPFTVTAHDGEAVRTHTLIIATGARANYLGLPSEELFKNRGVSACAVCDGALPRFRNQPIVVVGGGDSAVEEASYLTKFASRVDMLVRRDVLRASKIMQDRAKSNSKINIRWHTEVDEVLGEEKRGLTAVRVREQQVGSARRSPGGGSVSRDRSHAQYLVPGEPTGVVSDRVHQVDDSGPHLHECGWCVRGRGCRGRLLQTGGLSRRYGLHGGPRRRAIPGASRLGLAIVRSCSRGLEFA